MKSYPLTTYKSERHKYTFTDVVFNLQNYTVDFSNEKERNVTVLYRVYAQDGIQEGKDHLVNSSFNFIHDTEKEGKEVDYTTVELEISKRFAIEINS